MEHRDTLISVSVLEQMQQQQFMHILQELLPPAVRTRPLKNVLELDCRTGRWVLDFAQSYPDANVVGLDSRPEAIKLARENAATGGFSRVQFYEAGLTEPLILERSIFDHVRFFCLRRSLSPFKWRPLLQECKRVMKPGASINLLIFSPWLTSSYACQRFAQLGDELKKRLNYDLMDGPGHTGPGVYFCSMLRKAGFVDVQYQLFPIDMGGENPQNRSCCQLFYNDLLKFKGLFLQHKVISEDEFDKLLAQLRSDIFSVDFFGAGAIISAFAIKKK